MLDLRLYVQLTIQSMLSGWHVKEIFIFQCFSFKNCLLGVCFPEQVSSKGIMHGEGREGIPLREVWEMRKGLLQTEQVMASSEGCWQPPGCGRTSHVPIADSIDCDLTAAEVKFPSNQVDGSSNLDWMWLTENFYMWLFKFVILCTNMMIMVMVGQIMWSYCPFSKKKPQKMWISIRKD